MNLLEQFVDFLTHQKNKPSFLTVKNYKADIGQFIGWFEKEFRSSFDPSKITLPILDQYKKSRNLSPSSIQRHISSLRKFFGFLTSSGIVSQNPLEQKTASAEARALEDPWRLKNFKSFLYEYKKSNLTIKNYINDIKSFFKWLSEVSLTKNTWQISERNLLDKISFSVIDEYKQRLIASKFSPRTVNRKLSSLRNYIRWSLSQGFIKNLEDRKQEDLPEIPAQVTQQPTIEDSYSFPPKRLMQKSIKGANFLFDNLFILPIAKTLENAQYLFWKASGKKVFTKNLISNNKIRNIQKDFYAPLNISLHYLPKHKRIWHYLRHVRPKWYKTYHSYSTAHYFHFAILIILASVIGFGTYNALFLDTQKEKAILGTVTSAQPLILSFQGKLTDSSNNPITTTVNILFSIYNDQNASGVALWREINSVKPDSDGVFSVFLGKKTPIPDTIFSQNSKLFLGITVGNSPELRPRQELATVTLANNAQTLQGLEPITNTTKVSNVVLALDSSGNLSIAGSKAHTFQAIGGQFVISGSVLSLTTVPGSNSRVEIVPDGMGTIDLSKPIQNSTNNNNLSSAVGSVEFDDTVAILATTSAQAALYINQNSTGTLISASTSGTAKFTVDNDGTGTFAGSMNINGSSLTSTATTFNLLNSTVTTLNIGGVATTINLGLSGGTLNMRSNLNVSKDITLSSLTSNGGILYTNDSGKILQVSAGSSSDCLMGGTTPSFSSCTSANLLNKVNGSIYVGNTTMDVLFGGTATSSAKFAFINVNAGTPTASISGDLTLNAAGTIRTTKLQTLTLGDSGTGTIAFSNGGNVGIGTTTPGAKFEVVGGQTKIEISTQYSQRLCHNGSDASSTQNVLLGDCSAGGADIAEYYGSKDVTIEAGDVVVAGPGAVDVGSNSKAYVNKSSSSYQGGVLGIVSTNPYDSFGKDFEANEYSFPVALVGRIPVKISLENGPIKAGDLLTSSSIPGVAMKATKTGPIVGKALEDIYSIDESKAVGFYDPDNKEYRNKDNLLNIPKKPNIIRIVKIYAFANVSWYDPDAHLAETGELIFTKIASQGEALEAKYVIKNPLEKIIDRVGAFGQLAVANLQTGFINAKEIATESLIVTSDSLIVNGQNLKDYIVKAIQESPLRQDFGGQAGIISPVASIDRLSANIISPLGESLIVRLATPSAQIHNSEFIIQNSSGSAVTTIDSAGKIDASSISVNQASISGNLNASDASISGTLRARNIIANSIEGLDARISKLHNTEFIDIASYSAQLAYVAALQAERAQFNQGLMVFGPTSLLDVSVAGQLSIGGTMFVTQNSIETLGTDLSLQSLRQGGLSIMGGLIYIDTQGNLKVKGDVSISGKLAISGDIIASGSGTFAKLNLSLAQPALALSATQFLASSSAGSANINSYQNEITIKNSLVTEKSLIYITPVGTPSAQAPFLMRQSGPVVSGVEGSFTVGVESPTKNPIPFNWLIVN